MANGMYGANTEELRQVGSIFGSAEGKLNQSASTVQSQIEGVDWLGPDADKFRSHWGQVIPNDLRSLAELTIDRNTDLNRQADEQDKTSSGNGGEGCLKSIANGAKALGNGIVDFFKGFFVDGIWGDIKGLGALFGFDENGWSWETMKDTWKGMGALLGFGEDGWSWDTMKNTWIAVGKDFLAWDQWSTDPAGAAGKVLWNVGSLFIGVGEAKILANAADAGRVADAASTAGKAGDVASTAGKAGDAASTAGKAGDAASTAGKAGDAASTAGKAGDAASTAGKAGDAASDAGRAGDAASAAGKGGDAASGAGRAGDAAGDAGRAGDAAGGAGKAGDSAGGAGKAGDSAGGASRAADPASIQDGALQDIANGAKASGDMPPSARAMDGLTDYDVDPHRWAGEGEPPKSLSAGSIYDDAGEAGARNADEAGRVADDAARSADGAATDYPDRPVDGPLTQETIQRADYEGLTPLSQWNEGKGISPDTVNEQPPAIAPDGRHTNFAPYDTGATLLEDGRLQSTSGRVFDQSQVSHHWSSATTGKVNYDLMIGSGPEGMPFEPNHRYVIDNGRLIIETNEYGAPIYDRFHVEQKVDGQHWREAEYADGISRGSTSTSNTPGDGQTNPWGGLNQGMNEPTRGHGMGRQFGGPMEDINQIPQAKHANSVWQNELEGKIASEIKSNGRPMIVERHTDFSVLEAPDGTRVTGPAQSHEFNVFYRDDPSQSPNIDSDLLSFPDSNNPADKR